MSKGETWVAAIDLLGILIESESLWLLLGLVISAGITIKIKQLRKLVIEFDTTDKDSK